MREAWEILTAGPEDADRSVLLLPGGANAARSYDLVMAQPALSGVRLVATTMPGMAGAPLSADVSVPALARRAGDLANVHRCDVVVGFSHGATVALDMVLSGYFEGPAVLLGISLSTDDEAWFFRAAVRASQKVGSWPMATLLRLFPLAARSAKMPDQHKRELMEDLKQNRARDSVRACAGTTSTTSPRIETSPPSWLRRAARCGWSTPRRGMVASPTTSAPRSRLRPT